ncbi:hypothetical protein HanPSC8_Chr00c633g0809381 [Helianthus annuus]|uniref:Uncharacterized protein n=1 Tax=Helianthus annuus TaxID=4232 RepID=A0A251VJ79_HELAN|nr:hypothetical protein HanPSC8_Chr00c633g0809381 [Helianthus annuus]
MRMRVVFSPYSLKIHIKEKKNIIYIITKCHLLPQINPISKPNFSSTTCNNLTWTWYSLTITKD